MKLTKQMMYAAGQDAGNRSMRKAGRTKWSHKDYMAACKEYARLMNADAFAAVAKVQAVQS